MITSRKRLAQSKRTWSWAKLSTSCSPHYLPIPSFLVSSNQASLSASLSFCRLMQFPLILPPIDIIPSIPKRSSFHPINGCMQGCDCRLSTLLVIVRWRDPAPREITGALVAHYHGKRSTTIRNWRTTPALALLLLLNHPMHRSTKRSPLSLDGLCHQQKQQWRNPYQHHAPAVAAGGELVKTNCPGPVLRPG